MQTKQMTPQRFNRELDSNTGCTNEEMECRWRKRGGETLEYKKTGTENRARLIWVLNDTGDT